MIKFHTTGRQLPEDFFGERDQLMKVEKMAHKAEFSPFSGTVML